MRRGESQRSECSWVTRQTPHPPHPPHRFLAPKAQGVSCLWHGVPHHPVFNNSIYLKQDELLHYIGGNARKVELHPTPS